jgi:hypothetical protein
MDNSFIIKHQDRDIVKPVKAGKIRFSLADGTWRVGLELRSFDDFNMDDAENWNEEDYITIHLQDYPIGNQDPRQAKHLEIRVPKGYDPEKDAHWTNLYFGEHFETNANIIKLTRAADGSYQVNWTCSSDDVDYYDSRAKDNAIEINGRAEVVDQIQYPW